MQAEAFRRAAGSEERNHKHENICQVCADCSCCGIGNFPVLSVGCRLGKPDCDERKSNVLFGAANQCQGSRWDRKANLGGEGK